MPVISVYLYDFGPNGPRYHGFSASAGRLCTVEAGGLTWREPYVLACQLIRVPNGCYVSGNFLFGSEAQSALSASETLEWAARGTEGFALVNANPSGAECESVGPRC